METKTINLRDLPEDLVRRAKACAALHGLTLKDFVARAIDVATQKDVPAMAATAAFLGREARKKRSKAK